MVEAEKKIVLVEIWLLPNERKFEFRIEPD